MSCKNGIDFTVKKTDSGKQKKRQRKPAEKPVSEWLKRIDAREKLEALQSHPELAGYPGYELKNLCQYGEPDAWFLLLMKQPQLAPSQEWWDDLRRWSSLPWGQLLAAQPQFEKYCPWESVSRLELVKLALLAPEIFARQFPGGQWRDLCVFLRTSEWRQLLTDVTNADNYLDMDAVCKKFSTDDWLRILAKQPNLEKYIDWAQIDGCPSPYWPYLLYRQPQFAIHCDFSQWEGRHISYLLSEHPQLKTPEMEQKIEEDQIWEEYLAEKEYGE